MSLTQRFYPESRFGGFSDIDGMVVFFSRVNALLESTFVVLDVGCGRGAYGEDSVAYRRDLRILRGKVAKVIGIDVDPIGESNRYLDEFRRVQGKEWPVEDSSVDLIVCVNVLEHVVDPVDFFFELRRVLKDGGYLCLRTPNRWGYVAMVASLVPNRLHARFLSAVKGKIAPHDVFPTVYPCNTIRKLRRQMIKAGFEAVVYGYDAEPSYLSFSTIAYWLGTLYQRFAPAVIRPALFVFGRIHKSAETATSITAPKSSLSDR